MSKKSQTNIDLKEVSEKYSEVKTKYDTLGINLTQALELFLKENAARLANPKSAEFIVEKLNTPKLSDK